MGGSCSSSCMHAYIQTLVCPDRRTTRFTSLIHNPPELALQLGHTLSALLQTRVADPHVIEKEIGTDIRSGAQRLGHSEEGRRTKAHITANRPQRMFTPPQPVVAMEVTTMTAALSSTTLDAAIPVHQAVVDEEGYGHGKKQRAPKEFAHALPGPLQSPLTVCIYKRMYVCMYGIDRYPHIDPATTPSAVYMSLPTNHNTPTNPRSPRNHHHGSRASRCFTARRPTCSGPGSPVRRLTVKHVLIACDS